MNALSALTDAFRQLLSSHGWGGLITLLVVAAVIDWRSGRIPNWLTVTGMGWGLAFNTSQGPTMVAGLGTGLLGMCTGLALLLPLYAMRAIGGGDVKLMAMVGAFLGAGATLAAALFVFIAGGLAALVHAASLGATGMLLSNAFALTHGLARLDIQHVPPARSVGRLRYGACICVGTVTFLVLRQLGPF